MADQRCEVCKCPKVLVAFGEALWFHEADCPVAEQEDGESETDAD